jgi:hypothetical protein
LKQLLQKEEDSRDKPIEGACKQIVDCLVENVLRLEEKAAGQFCMHSVFTYLILDSQFRQALCQNIWMYCKTTMMITIMY